MARQVELAESLSMAFMLVLEALTPVERAVFLLHDVFDYPYAEIAGIVGKSEENVRQLTARARRHVEERRPRYETSAGTAAGTSTWSCGSAARTGVVGRPSSSRTMFAPWTSAAAL